MTRDDIAAYRADAKHIRSYGSVGIAIAIEALCDEVERLQKKVEAVYGHELTLKERRKILRSLHEDKP